MQEIMYAVCIEQRVPEVPAEAPAADVLHQCFAFAPAARPTAREVAQAFAPSFEPPPAQPVVAQLQADNSRFAQENGDLKQQLEGQQDITEQMARALSAKTLEAEGLAARSRELQADVDRLAQENGAKEQRIQALEQDVRRLQVSVTFMCVQYVLSNHVRHLCA